MLPPLGLRDLLLRREMPRSPMYAGREPIAPTRTQNLRTLSGFVQEFRKLEHRWGREIEPTRIYELASIVCEKSRRLGEYENTAAEVHLPPSRTPRTFVRSDAPAPPRGRTEERGSSHLK